jgi:glycosyltransferase involved in cell wall biosynthesis
MKIVAIIPAYNEAARVGTAVRDALRFVDAAVVVDDCSVDNTGDAARAAGAVVLRHAINRGQGAALQTATEYALSALRADVLVHFDADGQMSGSDIPSMIAPIVSGEADVVLGSRFLGKTSNMPFVRWFANRLAVLFTFAVSGIRLTDAHNGFRALSRNAASRMTITIDRMAHASQIPDLIKVNGLRCVERPVAITYSAETLAKSPSSLRAFGIVKDFLKDKFFTRV